MGKGQQRTHIPQEVMHIFNLSHWPRSTENKGGNLTTSSLPGSLSPGCYCRGPYNSLYMWKSRIIFFLAFGYLPPFSLFFLVWFWCVLSPLVFRNNSFFIWKGCMREIMCVWAEERERKRQKLPSVWIQQEIASQVAITVREQHI